ncbi:MAG: hypothetical protein J2P58_06280 [Acidimicrobiaceae bacterium]|nr:hypothetical protein [Acidimicrobiaceae bacterium]
MLWSTRWKEPLATISARLLQAEDRPLYREDRALGERTVTVRAVVPYCLAILTLAPAIIHFAVAGSHFQEFWLFGVLMLVAAWLQLLWALAVVARPSSMVWWAGAILNSGIIGVYIITRTVGDVVGPTPSAVEPVGFGDAACTVLEAVVVVGCAWLLFGKRDHRIRIGRDRLAATFGGVGIVTATILSISLVAGGPEMVMTASAASPMPALDRHGLQADVPLPAGVAFAGVHQTLRQSDMQYHSNVSIDTWGWTVSGRSTAAVQDFYEANLAKHGWTHIQGQSVMDKIGNHGRCQTTQGCEAAKHLTACQAGHVLFISASGGTLNTVDTAGKITASVTAPHGGAALLIQIDNNPQEAQVVCPNSR